jgi:hypothetical protein
MKLIFTFLTFFIFLSSPILFSQNVGLSFDGVDDYLTTSYGGVQGSSARTVEAWIKTTANCIPTSGGVQNVIADYGTFTTGARFTFNILWSNAIRIEIGGSGLSGSIAVNDGLWHHVAVVYDPTATDEYALYVDGVLDIAGNLSTVINTGSANDFQIGERIDGVNSFDGEIDEVRFFNIARSAADIAADMNAEFCSIPSGLEAYYRLNDGVANATNTAFNSAADDGGNGYTGTLNNFALTGTNSNWVNGPSIAAGINDGSISVNTCMPYTSGLGNVYGTTGTYYETYTNAAGCDSILEIKLTVTPITSNISVSACNVYTSPSGTYQWTFSGNYADTIQAANGCDSVISIALTINNYDTTVAVSDCGSYTTPDGNFTWNTSGQYPVTYLSSLNCDSTITYDVTIGHPTTSTLNITTCGSYTTPSGNNTYTASGTYTDVITNVAGCDSTITINLTLVNVSNGVTQTGNTLTADLTGASYQWYTCDNGVLGTPIAGETGQSFTPVNTGDYAVEVTVNNCTTASACYTVDLSSMEESNILSAMIYPNPTNGAFTITLGENYDRLFVQVIDLQGKVVVSRTGSDTNVISINEELPSGVYFVKLNANQKTTTYKLVVL